ncbi:MAG: choice-of-anchor Q domain-containing protein, partial [Rickettsiales bacterium]
VLVLIAALVLNLFLAVTAHAANYYVATNGSDSNPGTEAAPFKTVQKGADVAKAGDTVFVMPGTYIGAIENKNDGKASARIRFVSKERWAAKVAAPNSKILWKSFGDYVDIEGFEVTGHTGGTSVTYIGIIPYGTYSRVMYNHVHNIRTTECNRGIGIHSLGYDTNFGTEIIGNLIHDMGGPTDGRECSDLTGNMAKTLDRGYGIYHATQFGKVQNNIIYNCGAYGIHLWHKADNSIISHNLIFNSRMGMTIGVGDSPFTGTGDGIIVSNNIVINSKTYGIRPFGKLGPNSRFINNILYNNGTDEIRNDKGAPPPSMVFDNLIGVDPKLTNLAGGDYRLSAGSPAIDAGATLCNSSVQSCMPTEDHWQGSRPFNSKYDIGAHEFGSTPKSAPPLIPPTGGGGIIPPAGGGGIGSCYK